MAKTVDFDWKRYIAVNRQAAADGCVLLKNDNNVLPMKKGETASLFGRTQFDYIKCGTGSGGLVNVPYVVNFHDGLKNAGDINVYEPVSDIYRNWIDEHPFDKGHGWATEPTSQLEMPVSDEMVKDAAEHSDTALIFISRLAGEDKDRTPSKGDYYLRDDEEAMIKTVRRYFDRVSVMINSGAIMDMKWVDELDIPSVMYVWQGGCEGGNAVADLVTAKVTPSGRLTETIAFNIEDYPSDDNFGDLSRNYYKEDIYVGYRYFETFAKEKVMYPFGFGLSYTKYEKSFSFSWENSIKITATVKNVGDYKGREVIQAYAEAPQGLLGKPSRVLTAYAKTKLLEPGDSDTVILEFGMNEMASYDDTGMTGYKSSFVLESGEYNFYAGSDVRSAEHVGSFYLAETVCVETTSPALYPDRKFERLTPCVDEEGIKKAYAPVPLKEFTVDELIEKERERLTEIPYTGDKGIKLCDVKEGKASMDDFIAQLTDEEMIIMSRGEGMSSPWVVPGTCAAYGGVSESLKDYGIPAAACTDGPSGLRIDSGVMAMQTPNGSCLASTFDTVLIKELSTHLGAELLRDKIDCILGPGMNIKRHPLNGRNFEYFSEDPLVTGLCAKAQLLGMRKWNTTGCIKHFATNNQENNRYATDAVVSARALREIYLKGFEIAIKEGGANHVMTTYGILNGYHTASNFELDTMVLHNDWGFEGVAMTDWWARMGVKDDPEPAIQKTAIMIRSQNDLYMVTNSSESNANNDDSEEGLKRGVFTRAELQRNTRNIVNLVMNTPAYDRMYDNETIFNDIDRPSENEVMADVSFEYDVVNGEGFDAALLKTDKGSVNLITLHFTEVGEYDMHFELAAEGSKLSQMSVSFAINNTVMGVITRNGSEHEFKEESIRLGHGNSAERFLKIVFNQTGLKIRNIKMFRAEQ